MTTESRARAVRLRRAAVRQGLTAHKSRRRDPLALDYGHWAILDATGEPVVRGLTLDEAEHWLANPDSR